MEAMCLNQYDLIYSVKFDDFYFAFHSNKEGTHGLLEIYSGVATKRLFLGVEMTSSIIAFRNFDMCQPASKILSEFLAEKSYDFNNDHLIPAYSMITDNLCEPTLRVNADELNSSHPFSEENFSIIFFNELRRAYLVEQSRAGK